MPILADGVVRFIGEKVAAVAAETETVAEEAVELIDVEYEELEPLLDPLAAIEPDARIASSGRANLSRFAASDRATEQRVRPYELGKGRCRGGISRSGYHRREYFYNRTGAPGLS